jgi:hypothetical protein
MVYNRLKQTAIASAIIVALSGQTPALADLVSSTPEANGTVELRSAFLTFIGAQTFHHFHHKHHDVFGMVRYAGGEVQVNLDHHLKTEFAIEMHGAPRLAASDFITSEFIV